MKRKKKDKGSKMKCVGCQNNSNDAGQHAYPGGCKFKSMEDEAPTDLSWATRDRVLQQTKPSLGSMQQWIQILEEAQHCPILVSTDTKTVSGEVKETFTLYMPGIFPNQYQTFYSICSVQAYLQETPDALPAWARFSQAPGNKLMYQGNFLKLTPAEKNLYLP